MRKLHKAWVVARWEFLTTVKRRAFIFAVIAMPVFYIGMIAMVAIAGRSAVQTSNQIPIAVVDRAHLVDIDLAAQLAAGRDRAQLATQVTSAVSQGSNAAAAVADAVLTGTTLAPYDDLDRALDALRQETVAAVYVVEADYLQTGAITTYSRGGGLLSQPSSQRRVGIIGDALRASLLKPKLSDDELRRAYAPTSNITRMVVTKDGRVEPFSDPTGMGSFGSFGVILLLTMSIFFSSGFLQQATVADRQNRMIEILISSVDPDELLIGKIVGLGGAGLLQVLLYVALIIAPGSAILSTIQFPLDRVVLLVVYFLLGYLLFAALMAGTGMLARSAQESAQLSTLWTFAAAAPWFFVANISAAPNGMVSRVLSFFPLSSAITMLLRLGNGDVPAMDVVISIVVDLAAIAITLRGAARIFRAASLMQGKRATLPEFLRWMRAA